MRLVALGDSITAGTAGSTWLTYLDPPPVYVHNAGIGGNTTTQMLARLTTDVLAYSPTDVTIMGGTNDIFGVTDMTLAAMAGSFANLASIMDQIVAAGASAWLLTIPPVEIMWDDGTSVETYNGALPALAAAHGATFIDVWAALVDGSGNWANAAWEVGDGVHPSAIGSAIIAGVVGAVLPLPSWISRHVTRYNMVPLL